MMNFSIDTLLYSKGRKQYFQNQYLKTLLNTKRRILLRGSFVQSKEKHLKQGEKISNLENAFQNLIHLPLTACKRTSKRICKNKTCGASVVQNVKNKETIHAYLMRIFIGSILCNLCTYNYANQLNYALLYLLWFVLASITKKGEIERELGLHLFRK